MSDALNFWAVGVPLLLFAALVGYLIGISVRDVPCVWVVVEGEMCEYQFAYAPHGVFSTKDEAYDYARALVQGNESQRWSNCTVMSFEMDTPGFLEMEDVKL